MTSEEALLDAIRAAPDDDAPRLVYADWLEERGDPRGRWVRVQVGLAETPASPMLQGQEAALRRTHLPAWTAPLRDAHLTVRHHRGLIEEVSAGAPALSLAWATIREHVPLLRRLHVHAPSDDLLETTPDQPRLEWLRLSQGQLTLEGVARFLERCPALKGLSLTDCQLGDELAGLVRFTDGLESLEVEVDDLTARGIRLLHRAPLRQLVLRGVPVGIAQLEALTEAPWPLRSLTLDACGVTRYGAGHRLGHARWSKPLHTLALPRNPLGDSGALALADQGTLQGLRALDLRACGVADLGASAVAQAFPALRRLDLRENSIGTAGGTSLLSAPWDPGFRLAHQGNRWDPRTTAKLSARWSTLSSPIGEWSW